MAETVFMQRSLGSLKPVDETGAEIIGKISAGETVRCEITRPRNLAHHRKFFALLNVIYPHQTVYGSRAAFRAAIEVALGFGETVKLPDSRIIIIPTSISFANMDQTAFDALFEKAIDLIITRILPGIDRADLNREVDSIILGQRETA